MTLVERLRQAAAECSGWDTGLNPPFTEWSDLMDEAANKLEQIERIAMPHKAEPEMLSDTTHAARPLCKHCGDDIHRVPGGQGPTWVHTSTGTVAGSYRTGPLAPGRTIVGGES